MSVFRAISDPSRRRILDLLRRQNLTAGEIAERFPELSRPAVSKHLGILRRAHLVQSHKKGREQIYALRPGPLREVANWVQDYQQFWDHQLQSLKDYVERQETGEKKEVNDE